MGNDILGVEINNQPETYVPSPPSPLNEEECAWQCGVASQPKNQESDNPAGNF